MTDRILRFGVIGLSRGFVLTRPMFLKDPRVRLAAAADPRPEARAAFEAEFAGRAYETAADLCADPEVDVVYVASPHGLHVDHATAAARAGKHVLVEKPMALTLADCRTMRAAAAEAGVRLLVGPSHGYDAPVVRAAELIRTGRFGALRMLTLMNFTDFMYRPRRPEELDPAAGGAWSSARRRTRLTWPAAWRARRWRRCAPRPWVGTPSAAPRAPTRPF